MGFLVRAEQLAGHKSSGLWEAARPPTDLISRSSFPHLLHSGPDDDDDATLACAFQFV